ncbi:MAG: YhdH/YhfP family quinone oxidoreductase [Pirellulaceae bacterium]|nr:YhdH/YhfP family quinone oxidoreductase [Pirellulaceae bacterium]
MLPDTFRCYLVKKTGKDQIESVVEVRPAHELPAGDVLIEVAYSSVNYKDTMAAKGHPGVARKFPHVPGIDAAGTVVASTNSDYQAGDQVLVTSYELGVERWGGWSQYVRVSADWIVPLPQGLSLADSMALGTAGLTAGLCIRALQHHDIRPDAGDVLVTGATGGVGSLAVVLLARIGYTVVAVSGKPDRAEWLRELGASKVLGREEVLDDSKRPLLKARWAGAIDTVGGTMLASLLRSVKNEGCVAACGVVGGAEVGTSVYPFILRGVTLRGVDSAWCPMQRRREVWDLLSGDWRLESLDSISETIGLDDLTEKVEQLHTGSHVGRTIVDVRR